ncbi:uncharacterized protein J8A68_004776 [[Candida] subhashii]|uniref:CASTOR ACT domain-containing protein n=1 Tax=[Candida] subhashii TaxID=561895 RepID=A0A8J5QJR6_9ASCO|nr:uncharacterized protein J8A68_004776 [[Candida] subhashii]KAG7661718.1 hypothetical protein J8A68_004776 [[Candida] subhashii]
MPRDKYWLFTSSILQLLQQESHKSGSGYTTQEEDDVDEDEDETQEQEPGYQSTSGDTNGVRRHMSLSRSGNQNSYESISDDYYRMPVDNSSKVTSRDSSENFADILPEQDQPQDNIRQQSPDVDDDSENYFFHIALTPTECTIVCSSRLMDCYFKEAIKVCSELNYDNVQLLPESYISLQVDSDGSFDRSLRILELTEPLSENNISLFFLSSHFNDIVLIPYDLKDKVVNILTKKYFEFSDISNSYISLSDSTDTPNSEAAHSSTRALEDHTFKLFNQANIKPSIHENVKLLLTGARAGEVSNSIAKTSKILSIPTNIPDYFAITRTSINEVSLILPRSSKRRNKMGFDSKYIIGSTQDIIIPIMIDFSKLPLDSTGIVAGVASKLINGMRLTHNDYLFELNYFSMAKSGVIMIPQENVEVISQILGKASSNQ